MSGNDFEYLKTSPHRRYNPLADEWVLVSPQRAQRPWQGREDPTSGANLPEHDPGCYLCPRNLRASGERNPGFTGPFVFNNDFPALLPAPDGHEATELRDGPETPLFQSAPEYGICRVTCFSPRHDLTMATLPLEAVSQVMALWQSEYQSLGEQPDINHVQIFENRGEQMGCSNPHPHGQIWATSSIPPLVAREQVQQEAYLAQHGQLLLLDYLNRELELDERIVLSNEHFVALVPFWATWPFETLVLPRKPVSSLTALDEPGLQGLAAIYGELTRTYDRLFDCEFPYSAGIHQAPTDGGAHDAWQLHLHFFPPLLRSATVRKYMVGFELLASPQRDITPEQATQVLRAAAEQD